MLPMHPSTWCMRIVHTTSNTLNGTFGVNRCDKIRSTCGKKTRQRRKSNFSINFNVENMCANSVRLDIRNSPCFHWKTSNRNWRKPLRCECVVCFVHVDRCSSTDWFITDDWIGNVVSSISIHKVVSSISWFVGIKRVTSNLLRI